ncbi:MAG: sulfatase [Acidobacteria bacterium]|nr:sulfatase [Acidobacteriota bacterium]
MRDVGGYRTVLLGKYFNGYPTDDPTYIPPGWDEWYGMLHDNSYFDYSLNEDGRVVAYGRRAEDYETDALAGKAIDFIQRTETNDAQPFFIYLAPRAPHSPFTPAPRHQDEFLSVSAPRPPSFNEADLSDKPEWLRNQPLFSTEEIEQINTVYRLRLQSLLAVDEMIERIISALTVGDELKNTYILFTSDNGFHLGEHRLARGKDTPYEEAIRVPLIVRGPGVPPGRTLEHIVLNIDFAPTFAELAGVIPPDVVDGRSFTSLLGTSPPSPENWRKDLLVEHRGRGRRQIPAFNALRTREYLYVEYDTGERELYDLRTDPYELQNLQQTAEPSLIRSLAERLQALKDCHGANCRN